MASLGLGVLIVFLVFLALYAYGRSQQRVFALGRDTYIRFYPNPGIGVNVGKRRIAASVVGGLEIFRAHPRSVWVRTRAIGSRVKRPGGRANGTV